MDTQDNKFAYYICTAGAGWITKNSTFLLKKDNFRVHLCMDNQWYCYPTRPSRNIVELIGRENMKHITEEEAFRFILENE